MDSARTVELTDVGAALHHARKAQAIADSQALESESLEAQATIAYALARRNDTSAYALLREVVARRHTLGDTTALVHAMRVQGDACILNLRLDEAERVLDEAIRIGTDARVYPGTAQTLASLSDVRSRQGRNSEAVQLMRRSREAAAWGADPDVLVVGYIMLAGKEALSGEVESAAAHFDTSIVLAHRHGLRYREAVAHANLGYIRTFQGDLPRAADHYQRAVDMQESLGGKDELSTALYGLACVLESMGDDVEACKAYHASLEIERALGNTMKEDLFSGGLAMLLVDMDSADLARVGRSPHGLFAEAHDMIEKSLAAAETMQQHEMVAGLRVGSGNLLLRLGRRQEAEARLTSGLKLYEQLGDQLGGARAHWNMGILADSIGQFRRALHHLDKAITMADGTGNKEIGAFALDSRHDVYRRLGELRRALADKTRAADLREDMYNESNTAQVTSIRLRSVFAKEQLADSLANEQRLAEQKEEASLRDERQRARTTMLLSIAAAMLVAGVVVYLLDRRRRRERFAKQAALLEIKALRAQMNPHFLFNALNSISAYIREQQPDKAHVFIARFGRLMRLVLENSRRTEVPLKDDLEALRLYMELEQARTENKFDPVIRVDPSIDQEDVRVPPMVLQPFVENAIWHGIGGLAGRGSVTVDIGPSADQGHLLMTVTDDGVGRAATVGNKHHEERSLGTTITGERLELLAQQTGQHAGFRHVDLPHGTRVEVTLPLRRV